MIQVKICGVSKYEHVLAACRLGADFIGLVFATGRRQVSPEKALSLVKTTHGTENPPATVGVFVNTAADEVNRIADYCGLDWVQLSGDEDWQYCREIKKYIIKVIHITPDKTASSILADIEEGYRTLPKERFICLLDTKIADRYGGSGEGFNWDMAKEASSRFPLIIAGGLNPHNVRRMVAEVYPWGVDVSTGVETRGQKDIAKIRDFIQKVKSL